MSIKNVSFIGLGVMGYPMAGHLQNKGYNVTVYNRTTAKAEKWVEEYKGSMAKTPGEASQNSEIVFMCVGRDEDIIEVMEGEDGILSKVTESLLLFLCMPLLQYDRILCILHDPQCTFLASICFESHSRSLFRYLV